MYPTEKCKMFSIALETWIRKTFGFDSNKLNLIYVLALTDTSVPIIDSIYHFTLNILMKLQGKGLIIISNYLWFKVFLYHISI